MKKKAYNTGETVQYYSLMKKMPIIECGILPTNIGGARNIQLVKRIVRSFLVMVEY